MALPMDAECQELVGGLRSAASARLEQATEAASQGQGPRVDASNALRVSAEIVLAGRDAIALAQAVAVIARLSMDNAQETRDGEA